MSTALGGIPRLPYLRGNTRRVPAESAGDAVGEQHHRRRAITTIFDLIGSFLASTHVGTPIVIPRQAPPDQVCDAMAHGDADVALRSGPVPPQFRRVPLSRPLIWAYLPPAHRWQQCHVVPVDELVAEPLLMLTRPAARSTMSSRRPGRPRRPRRW